MIMTDPPIDHTQAREQDAPGTHDAKRRAPVHGHTGDVPSDKALSDTGSRRLPEPRDTQEEGRDQGGGRGAHEARVRGPLPISQQLEAER
eukprot:scaffold5050_cov93-Isochrysis_galbana.AAC.4